jgi:hypothetical protein
MRQIELVRGRIGQLVAESEHSGYSGFVRHEWGRQLIRLSSLEADFAVVLAMLDLNINALSRRVRSCHNGRDYSTGRHEI